MIINNDEELKLYLESNIKENGSYALKKFSNYTDIIFIYKDYNSETGFSQENCEVIEHKYDLNDEESIKYIKENNYIIIENKVYEIKKSNSMRLSAPCGFQDLTLTTIEHCLKKNLI